MNVMGEPVKPIDVACSVLAPATSPSVQEVSVAMPEESVETEVVGARDPPPPVTVKVTGTPGTGLPPESATRTDGGALTVAAAMALCSSVDTLDMLAAEPWPVGLVTLDWALVNAPEVNVSE